VTADLKELEENMLTQAMGFLEKGQDIAPVAAILDSKGDIRFVLLEHSNNRAKRLAYLAVSRLARKFGAVAVLSLADMWFLEVERNYKGPTPMNSPNRKEAIHVSVVAPDGSFISLTSQPYHRDGTKIVWEARKTTPGNQLSGSTQKLIPAWGTTGGTAN
jgi:hypothetical protein